MEPPAQISCPGNCLVHLHSTAGKSWLQRHSWAFQRHVGPDGICRFRVPTGNNEPRFVSANEILTSHFQSNIAAYERLHGRRVQNIVALLPASINPSQYRSQFSAIAAAAGVRIAHFIERSVLAASAYKSLRTPGRKTILVFELGGEILEISLLTEDGDVNIMAAVSDMGCPLLNQVVSQLPRTFSFDLTRDGYFLRQIGAECERAKDALCLGSATVEVKIQRLGLEVTASIDRERLVQMNLNHLRIGIMRCLAEAGVGQEAVDEVVLAGASTNIPEVRSVLLEFFLRQTIRCSIDPCKGRENRCLRQGGEGGFGTSCLCEPEKGGKGGFRLLSCEPRDEHE